MESSTIPGPTCCCCQPAAHPVTSQPSPAEDLVAARPAHSADHACPPPTGSTRKGPRHFRFRRSPPDRSERSHLRVRLRPLLGNSRQRQSPHTQFVVLVSP